MKETKLYKKEKKKKKTERVERKKLKKKGPDIYKFGYVTTPINPKLAGHQ